MTSPGAPMTDGSHETETMQDPEVAPDRLSLPKTPWSRPHDEVLHELGVDPARGLTSGGVRRRRDHWGPNALREHERRGAWKVLVAQFRSVIVLLLAAAAVLAFATGGPVEAAAILAVLVVNATIGFVTELRAVASMSALRELGRVSTRALRDGTQRDVPAEDLVPGDLVVLEAGDIVTADLRLVEASGLQVSEAPLTGESVPVEKDVPPVPLETPLAERSSLVYKGTAVTRGSALGVVVATGMETELGRISSLVERAEDASTPLEESLAGLGRRLVWLTLGLAALLVASGLAVGRELLPMVEISIALAVAAIPEGLPIVATLALARGMWRMSRRNALVERLAAVETLGSTGVILTDKTGTLTENLMSVERLDLPGGSVEPEALAGPTDASGDTVALLERVTGDESSPLQDRARAILLTIALCNNASLVDGSQGPTDGAPEARSHDGPGSEHPKGGDEKTEAGDREGDSVGDPMEVGLLRAGRAAGIERPSLLRLLPELREEAFDPSTAMMATFHGEEDSPWIAVKGAPEAVLEASSGVREEAGTATLDDERRSRWLQRTDELAEEGFRVLAAAVRRGTDPDEDPYRDLVFLGLIALLDPPRKDVAPAIDACRTAGVRVVMVTGDQPTTARNVAEAVGLDGGEGAVVVGAELPDPARADDATKEQLRRTIVFARTTPEQKLDLIALHQEAGQIVAMIGDGVNDAPALRKADIGVAMGQRGTQVAREAADIILRDDRFGTVVTAVEQGRAIFQNIRKFVTYLMSCNVSEILVVTLATLAGGPLPLLPLQILYLNLVTDVFPALALGFGEGAPGSMERPPRPPDEPLLTRGQWRFIGGYGFLLTAAVLGAFYLALAPLGMTVVEAVSVSFLTLALGQIWHVFSMADSAAPLVRNEVTENPWVWGAVALCVLLVLAAAYLPVLSDVLQVTPPDLFAWGVVLGLSLAPLVVGRVVRLVATSVALSPQRSAP